MIPSIYELHIELTSNCNAACPGCTRNWMGGKTKSTVELSQISLEQFKSWFSPDVSEKVEAWILCGSSGDPSMCKDLYEIVSYIREVSPKSAIRLHTNGGTRKPDFWQKMALLFDPEIYAGDIIFSLDGLEDTNHIYRRNVNWNVAFNNFVAAASSGASVVWEFLVFGHNEHQVNYARSLAESMGAKFIPKRPLGFESVSSIPVHDTTGKFEYAIQAPSEKFRMTFLYDNERNIVFRNYDVEQMDKNAVRTKNIFMGIEEEYDDFKRMFRSPSEYTSELEYREIEPKCDANNKKTFYVSSSGDLLPCCWFDSAINNSYHRIDEYQFKKWHYSQTKTSPINLNTSDFQTIIDGLYYQNLKDSWNKKSCSDGKLYVCSEACGKNNNRDEIYVV